MTLSSSSPPPPDHEVFTVSQLSTAIQDVLEGSFPFIHVRGEISGFLRARSGLENITQYTFQNFGALQVNQYMAALFDSMDKLTTMPTLGRARSDLPDGYKMYAVGKHIIIYHVHHRQLIVMRILHQKMDILRHL